jgi:hypothetical protein
MRQFTILLILSLFLFSLAHENKCIRNTQDPIRLPQSIFPTGYQVSLNPSLKTFKYTANATIGLNVTPIPFKKTRF